MDSMSKPDIDPKIRIGPMIARYSYHPLGWKEFLLYFVLGIAASGIPLIYGLNRYQYGYTKYGDTAAIIWSRPWFLLAGLALLTFFLLLVHRLRLSNRYISIHEDGIHLALSYPKSYRWEQIGGIATSVSQSLFFGLSKRTRYRAVIHPNIGNPIYISDSFQNLPEMISRIKASLYPRILPSLTQNFLNGQWVFFGPIAIQLKQISIHRRKFEWSHVQRLTIVAGDLVIELTNPRSFRVPASQIPNIELFLEIINSRLVE